MCLHSNHRVISELVLGKWNLKLSTEAKAVGGLISYTWTLRKLLFFMLHFIRSKIKKSPIQ